VRQVLQGAPMPTATPTPLGFNAVPTPMPAPRPPETLWEMRQRLNPSSLQSRLSSAVAPLTATSAAINRIPPLHWLNENVTEPNAGRLISMIRNASQFVPATGLTTTVGGPTAPQPRGGDVDTSWATMSQAEARREYQEAPVIAQIPAAIAGDPLNALLLAGPALGVIRPVGAALTRMAEESQFARQAVAAGKGVAVGGEGGGLKFGDLWPFTKKTAAAAEEAPKVSQVPAWRKTLTDILAPETTQQRAWVKASAQVADRTEGTDALKSAVGKVTYWIRGQRGERATYEAAEHAENVNRARLLRENATRTDLTNYEKGVEANKIRSGPVAPSYKATPLVLTPEETDAFQTAVNASEKLTGFEKPRLLEHVDEYLKGTMPALASDVGLFGRAFGKPVLDGMAGTSFASKFGGVALDVFLLPKTAEATMDMSYLLRQGGVLIRHMKQIGPAFRKYAEALVNPEVAAAESERVLANPIIQKWGKNLAITQAGQGAARTEEAYVGSSILRPGLTITRDQAVVERLARAFLWIPAQIVNRSEAGAVAFMDRLRGDVFVNRILTMERRGTVIDQSLADDLAEWINLSTGRATLPGLEGENTVRILNNIMFSPRFRASRIMLGPEALRLAIKNPELRREIASDLAVWLASNMTLLALAKGSAFADVELDPRSTDFMKYRIGHQRYDPWSGMQPLVRTIAQMSTGTIKTSRTGETYSADRLIILGRYILSSLAPSPQIAFDVARTKTTLGQKVNPIADPKAFAKYVGSKFVPLIAQDFADAWRIEGKRAAAGAGLYSFLGGGSLTYETAYDQLADAQNKAALGITDPTTGQPYKNFEDMKTKMGTPLAKEAIAQDEGVIAAQAAVEKYQTNRGGSVSMTSVAAQFVAEQAADDAKLESGEMTWPDWVPNYTTRQQNLTNQYAGLIKGNPTLAAKLAETAAKIKDPFALSSDASPDTVRAAYFKVFDPYKGDTGLISADEWVKLSPELDQFRANLTPAQADSLDANLGAGKSDKVKKYREMQKELQPYYDLEDTEWRVYCLGTPSEPAPPELKQYAELPYQEYRRQLALEVGPSWVDSQPYVKAFEKWIARDRKNFLLDNHAADASRAILYGEGVHSQEAEDIYKARTGLTPRGIKP